MAAAEQKYQEADLEEKLTQLEEAKQRQVIMEDVVETRSELDNLEYNLEEVSERKGSEFSPTLKKKSNSIKLLFLMLMRIFFKTTSM